MKFKLLGSISLLCLLCITPSIAQNISALNTLLESTSGPQTSVAQLGSGKVTVVMFWLTNCRPSKLELKALDVIHEAMQGKVEVIAVSIDNIKTLSKVGPFVASEGIDFPVLLDPNRDVYNMVNGVVHPYTLIYGSDGNLRSRYDGFLEGDEIKLREELSALVGN